MNPQCASCRKTVYPMEKLNCLDKYWHKGCFRCQVCGMTLNMKNYKGYNKEPYCAAHYPTQKFTAVADTPESKRLAANTAIQSNIKYHADFEKQRGTKITVADDPETMRARKSAQIASEVSYRGVKELRDVQELHRPDQTLDEERRGSRNSNPNVGRISDYDPAENQPSPYSARSQMPTVYDSNKGGRGSYHQPGFNQPPPAHQGYQPPSPNQPNSPNRNPAPGYGQIFGQPAAPPPPAPSGPKYRAIYDYNKADDDEVSFQEGDIFLEITVIDSGWMEGRNARTGQYGMLPSNYVEKVN